MVNRNERLDVIQKVQAVRLQHGLSYEQLAGELRKYLDLSVSTLYRILARKARPRKAVLTALATWLEKEGLKKYPIVTKVERPDAHSII